MFGDRDCYTVFFTGGLDSAYRLCWLARDGNAVVRPVYILFPDDGVNPHVRPEMGREILAQDRILGYICGHPATRAEILPMEYVSCSSLRFDGMDKWERLLAKAKLGWQYLYCSSYAKTHKGVELCQERFPKGYYDRNIFVFGKDGYGRTIVGPNADNPEWLRTYASFIWGDMSYPVYGVTRRRMRDDLVSWGYRDVLGLVWFCYGAIDGKPCGVCDNCSGKIRDGLASLFDEAAMRRFYIMWILYFMFGLGMKEMYLAYVYAGEKEFLSRLVSENLGGGVGLSEPYRVTEIERLFSLKTGKLKRMYEKFLRGVKK